MSFKTMFRRKKSVTLRVVGANGRDTGEEYTITEGGEITVVQPFQIATDRDTKLLVQSGTVEVKLRCVRVNP